jgi:hypothetical protein
MSRSMKVFIAGVSLILVLVVLLGCVPNKQGGFSCIAAPLLSKLQSMLPAPKKAGQSPTTVAGSQTKASAGPTRPHPPVRTGDIAIGPQVQAASQTIDPSGGTIAVSKPGDPLDGFIIGVPPNSYADSRTFKVSSARITNQTFGDDINPISPMISVDNGGGYSDGMMYVRVPVKVPEDSFAMGFFYDDKTRRLEGMPLIAVDAESVTVATMHFSSFFLSKINKALLKNDVDSGFQPGIDDWQFTNQGSYIAQGGHCEGQALTAMWYYCTQPDGKDLCLYGRYDNNGNQPATPELWQDDSLGYRFCSVIQLEKRFGQGTTLEDFWDNLAGVAWEWKNNNWVKKDVPGMGDEATFNLFAYSIRANRQPQEVGLYSNAGGGHSVVVYKVVGNALYIADPNYPGNTERKIIYYSGEGKFKPYNTAANRKLIDAGRGHDFEKIVYTAKSTMVPWDTIAQRWTEFKAGTIGNDKFPAYKLEYKDKDGKFQELKDGYVSPVKLLNMQATFGGNPPAVISVFRDGAELKLDDKGNYELNPGTNVLGIYVAVKVGFDWEYVDFKYLKVIYGGLTIDPPSREGETGKEYTFTAKAEDPPAKARYEWIVDGALQETKTDVIKVNTSKLDASKAGPYPITCKLYDAAKPGSKALAEAAASLTIKVSSGAKVPIWICADPKNPNITLLVYIVGDVNKNQFWCGHSYKQCSDTTCSLTPGRYSVRVEAHLFNKDCTKNQCEGTYSTEINVVAGGSNKFTFDMNGLMK